MKIAVTYENDMVFQHFGRTSQFKVYEVVDGKMVDMKVGMKTFFWTIYLY